MKQQQMLPGINMPNVPLIGGNPPPGKENAPPPSFDAMNPLPPGSQAIKTLRAASDCPITKEATAFKDIIPKLQLMKVDISELLELYGQGVATIIGADNHCSKQLTTRTVVTFSEDPTLEQLHTDLQTAIMEMQEQMSVLTALKQKIETLAQARWDRAVKETGLSPDKRFYQIDEEVGVIKQLDLDCSTCKGATRIRKLRQEMLAKFVSLEYQQKEEDKNDRLGKNDTGDGASSEDVGDSGKTSTSK